MSCLCARAAPDFCEIRITALTLVPPLSLAASSARSARASLAMARCHPSVTSACSRAPPSPNPSSASAPTSPRSSKGRCRPSRSCARSPWSATAVPSARWPPRCVSSPSPTASCRAEVRKISTVRGVVPCVRSRGARSLRWTTSTMVSSPSASSQRRARRASRICRAITPSWCSTTTEWCLRITCPRSVRQWLPRRRAAW